jgi:hypothetical protein
MWMCLHSSILLRSTVREVIVTLILIKNQVYRNNTKASEWITKSNQQLLATFNTKAILNHASSVPIITAYFADFC